jgi:hypothetical protein
MKETLLDKIKDKLINTGFYIFIITVYSFLGFAVIGGIISFWLLMYELVIFFFKFINL